MNLAFYISNHGFGHATRSCSLIEEFIKIGITCHIITDRPDFIFENLNPQFAIHRKVAIDFGIKQDTWIHPNKEKTKSALVNLWDNKHQIIQDELEYMQKNQIDAIISDIPPLSFIIAREAGLPIIGISNFDWYFVYEEMLKDDPEITHILEEMKSAYEYGLCIYKLPFSHQTSCEGFSRIKNKGVLSRSGKSKREKIIQDFSIPENHKVCLITFGNANENPLNMDKLCNAPNLTVLARMESFHHDNFRYLPIDYDFVSLVFSADIIIAKTGYSTLAEACQTGNLLVYTDRNGFPEDAALINGICSYPNSIHFPCDKVYDADWNSIVQNSSIDHKINPCYKPQNLQITKSLISDFYPDKEKNYCIIDVGTNNILLLWVQIMTDDSYKIIHRASVVSALGKNMKQNILTKAGLKRAITILQDYLELSQSFTGNIIVTGTSCSREATNIHLLSDWLKTKYNIEYRILSEEEEGLYNGLASIKEFPELDTFVSFDIGGGSTEFTLVKNGEIVLTQSLDLGLRRLESYFSNDLIAKTSYTRDQLHKLKKDFFESKTLVGIGGTVSNLSAVKLRLEKYDSAKVHKSSITLGDLTNFMDLFTGLNLEKISELMPFEPQRAGIIIYGVMVVKEILDLFGMHTILVSDRGLQFGILSEMIKGKGNVN